MTNFPIQPVCDIVIPLGNASIFDNFELRIALRSIEQCAENHGNIYIVSDEPPAWLRNVKIIDCPDRHKHNKDANIIDKLLAATEEKDLSEQFIFWSDDKAALQKFYCNALYPIHNSRGKSAFTGKNIWHRRMRRTFEYLEKQGCFLNWNWDSHTPQLMDKAMFRKIMSSVDYAAEPGFCINTLYFGLIKVQPRIPQEFIKITVEKERYLEKLPEDKIFIGYNDRGLQGDLKDLLLKRYPKPSRFEA